MRLHGRGRVVRAPGQPLAIDVALQVRTVPGDQDIDGGNLSATLQPDGSLAGQRWHNGAQAALPATLRRVR